MRLLTVVLTFSVAAASCGPDKADQQENSKAKGNLSPENSGLSTDEVENIGFEFNGQANQSSNASCKTKTVLAALDVDGDGVVKTETDGYLIFAMMSPGYPEAEKNKYIKPGLRSDFDLYYETVLKPLLDSNNDGKLNPYVDGVNIIRLMNLKVKSTNNILDLSNRNTDGFKLQKLNNLKIACNRSIAPIMVRRIGLKKASSFYTNSLGKGNQWFLSSKVRGWFFLNSKGELKRYNGRQGNKAVGQTIGVVDQFYSSNPAALLKVKTN